MLWGSAFACLIVNLFFLMARRVCAEQDNGGSNERMNVSIYIASIASGRVEAPEERTNILVLDRITEPETEKLSIRTRTNWIHSRISGKQEFKE